jgi:hypothetical protein
MMVSLNPIIYIQLKSSDRSLSKVETSRGSWYLCTHHWKQRIFYFKLYIFNMHIGAYLTFQLYIWWYKDVELKPLDETLKQGWNGSYFAWLTTDVWIPTVTFSSLRISRNLYAMWLIYDSTMKKKGVCQNLFEGSAIG